MYMAHTSLTLFTALLATIASVQSCTTPTDDNTLTLLVGSYSSAQDEGIRIYRFHEDTGQAEYVQGTTGVANPSFLYPAANGKWVYAVSEMTQPDTAAIHTLAVDPQTGALSPLSCQPTLGDAPCNVMESPDGRWVYTSNYFGGSITECSVDTSGHLGTPRVIAFHGSSVHPERQTRPYLHAVNYSPDGRFLLADDLGTDRIHVFPATAPLDTTQMQDIEVPAGTGPRHLTFHPSGRQAYLLGELSGDIVTLSYRNNQFQVVQTLRADSLGAGGSADIHCSPDGRFVYASHRLQGDGISILRVHPKDGTLTKVAYQPTGLHPRNFILTPSGRYLLVACRDSNLIQIYRRDASTGLLQDTGHTIQMPQPVCLQWMK